MLSVEAALSMIQATVSPFEATAESLDDVLGLVLADAVFSELDSPPFDKALMDGFAIRVDDLASSQAALRVVDEVAAGHRSDKTLMPGEAIQIMTGAPVPKGADAVVRSEDANVRATPDGAKEVVISVRQSVSAGMNLAKRGSSIKQGQCVLPAGYTLRPQGLAALAEMGCHRVSVRRRPRIAVLATGDELVPIHVTPGPGQIRNSNEIMLSAQIRRAGAEPVPLGIARDERHQLSERIREGLQWDMLLLSGGVSTGKLDLVPSELEAAGVRKLFHKVQVKPGKPVWFGVYDELDTEADGSTSPSCHVFGLPGNPVSSMVCFELFVRTAIRGRMGIDPAEPVPVRARLTQPYASCEERPTYHPARLDWSRSGPTVLLVAWRGSFDLQATVSANAMVFFPSGDRTYQQDEFVDVFVWD